MSAEEIELMKQACNLDDERARFYLNASGGNLDAAISAYFDTKDEAAAPEPAPMATDPPAQAAPRQTAPPQRRAAPAYRPDGPRIATFGSIRDDPSGGPPSTNEAYAGGHSSGIAVRGGPEQAPRGADVYDALQRQAVGSEAVGGGLQKVTLTRWRGDIFSVDDGVNPVVPRDPKTDSEFRQFLEAVTAGRVPPGYTQDTHLVFEDKPDQDFTPPPMKPFSGAGRRLGDVVPEVQGAGAAAAATPAVAETPAPPPENVVDESLPTTRVQIRLADGTRLVSRFNPSQTVADVRHFVLQAQPAALKDREFVLMTTFPNRVIDDESQTLEDAKLCNAAVVQKWK